jgi:hypothetical protein
MDELCIVYLSIRLSRLDEDFNLRREVCGAFKLRDLGDIAELVVFLALFSPTSETLGKERSKVISPDPIFIEKIVRKLRKKTGRSKGFARYRSQLT